MNEPMYITITTEDNEEIICEVLCIFAVDGQDYIALLPEEEEEAYLYRYAEAEDGEPILDSIESDEEFELVGKAFEEIIENELPEEEIVEE